MEPQYNTESSEVQKEQNDGDNSSSITINRDNNDEENSSFSNLESNQTEDFFINQEERHLEELFTKINLLNQTQHLYIIK